MALLEGFVERLVQKITGSIAAIVETDVLTTPAIEPMTPPPAPPAAPSARPTSGFGCWFEIRLMQALTSLVTLGRRTTPSVPTSPGNRGTMPARS